MPDVPKAGASCERQSRASALVDKKAALRVDEGPHMLAFKYMFVKCDCSNESERAGEQVGE